MGTRTTAVHAKSLIDKIHYLAQFKQRAVTIKQLFEFGSNPAKERLLMAAQFLHSELPVRLSHRVRELESLPYGLSEMPSVGIVRDMYIESVHQLIELRRPESAEDEERFNSAIENIKQRHNNVVSIMAKGIQELKQAVGPDAVNPEIQAFLDRFYLSRIGLRMLIGQHTALHQNSRLGYVGLICEKCSPTEVAQDAMANARNLCLLRYDVAPEIKLFGNADLSFTYVPSHLHHMLFELLKNSMRATVEFHGTDTVTLPLIRIVVAEGEEDMTIKISDEGGGIPRSGISRIWTYLYTTAHPPALEPNSPYRNDFQAPLAGLGYGLPISRLYARYFGGDLQVISMEGYGTDAYLHLKRLGNAEEVLPRKLH
jgi:pyruvate dehydrogenase kinase 2/3/4